MLLFCHFPLLQYCYMASCMYTVSLIALQLMLSLYASAESCCLISRYRLNSNLIINLFHDGVVKKVA